ncbi:hypothetical protein DUNSADRAFT_15898 [Dunaliella salina]|uniref:Encoded protein n=1 Tax=Dunaliella salina TaxID=3046 RepID=A0ABQ7G4M3_DUNSA|nr:hypothetical protein DUNSADRAFT_15898 [Dunaliella salina]|eukprot:KAF5829558.1 hypothetical protein DUNSADRAFT_15898 [Dunaliella salina]
MRTAAIRALSNSSSMGSECTATGSAAALRSECTAKEQQLVNQSAQQQQQQPVTKVRDLARRPGQPETQHFQLWCPATVMAPLDIFRNSSSSSSREMHRGMPESLVFGQPNIQP